MSYVYGATLSPAVRANREVTQWRTRAEAAEARAAELEAARQAAADHAGRLARRLEALEREAKAVRDQNMGLRAHNTTLRARTLGATTLWPGDTPEICAARLEAAAAEAAPKPRTPMTHCRKGHPFTEENTYTRTDGRQCLTCKQAADRARDRRRAEYEAAA
jgi:hypothetical protein